MSEIFRDHLQKFIEVDDEAFTDIMNFFTTVTVKRKTDLLKEGQLCKFHYFVLNGCLRKFFVNEKGIEQTTEFAIETWWLTDNIAFEHSQPTQFHIQAVEDSVVLAIDRASQEKLLTQIPAMERYFRFIYQRAFAAAQMRIKYLYDLSKEEYYHHFNRHHPEFIQRVPQYLIASYLGFTPEYLSEIKKKKLS